MCQSNPGTLFGESDNKCTDTVTHPQSVTGETGPTSRCVYNVDQQFQGQYSTHFQFQHPYFLINTCWGQIGILTLAFDTSLLYDTCSLQNKRQEEKLRL